MVSMWGRWIRIEAGKILNASERRGDGVEPRLEIIEPRTRRNAELLEFAGRRATNCDDARSAA